MTVISWILLALLILAMGGAIGLLWFIGKFFSALIDGFGRR